MITCFKFKLFKSKMINPTQISLDNQLNSIYSIIGNNYHEIDRNLSSTKLGSLEDESLKKKLYSLHNYFYSIVKETSNNELKINHNNEKIKDFYKSTYPQLIKAFFTSNKGLITMLEDESTDFETYDLFVQLMSPGINSFNFMEFILSLESSKSMFNPDSLLFEIKDLNFISSSLSLLNEMNEKKTLNDFLFSAFPRMAQQSNQNKQNNKLYVNIFELFIINLLYYIKNTQSQIKVKCLTTENHNFRNINTNYSTNHKLFNFVKSNYNNHYNYNPQIFINETHSELNKESLDYRKNVLGNFLFKVFSNLIEYLCSPCTNEEFAKNSNLFFSFNQFKEVNERLKYERLKFICKMVDIIWSTEFYFETLFKIKSPKNFTEKTNVLIIESLTFLIKTLHLTDTYFQSDQVLYNDSNLLVSLLNIPIFHMIKNLLDDLAINQTYTSQKITLSNICDLMKAYSLPWKFIDTNCNIDINNFFYANFHFYTYLLNKLLITLSQTNNIDYDLAYGLNLLLEPFCINDGKVFYNSVSLKMFSDISLYIQKKGFKSTKNELFDLILSNFSYNEIPLNEVCPWSIYENIEKINLLIQNWTYFTQNKLSATKNNEYNARLAHLLSNNIKILQELYVLNPYVNSNNLYSADKNENLSFYGSNRKETSTEGKMIDTVNFIKKVKKISRSSDEWDSKLKSTELVILFYFFYFIAFLVDFTKDIYECFFKGTSFTELFTSESLSKRTSQHPKTNLRYFVNYINFLSSIIILGIIWYFVQYFIKLPAK